MRPQHSMVLAAALLGVMAVSGPAAAAAADAASAAAAAAAAAGTAIAPASRGTPRVTRSRDGSSIHYRVRGSGEPLVVLIHGWSCDSSYWDAQLDELASRYTVLTIDLAGHGSSTATRSQWSMGAFGDDVVAAVEDLASSSPSRIVLVGHSMGGPVAVEAARRLAPRVAGVIGLDTLKSAGLPRPPAADTARRMEGMRKDFAGSTREMVKAVFFRPDADPALVQRIAEDMSQAPPEVAIPSVQALNDWDGVRAMADVRVPIVAINSDLGPPTQEARIRGFAPTFRAVVVPGTGHFLMMEDPARLNPIIDAQIRGLP